MTACVVPSLFFISSNLRFSLPYFIFSAAFTGSGNYEIISSANTYAQVCMVQDASVLCHCPNLIDKKAHISGV
jgi:hypothetical protein